METKNKGEIKMENLINTLKAEFSKIETISIENGGKISDMTAKLNNEDLELVINSGIKFVSMLARNERLRRNLK